MPKYTITMWFTCWFAASVRGLGSAGRLGSVLLMFGAECASLVLLRGSGSRAGAGALRSNLRPVAGNNQSLVQRSVVKAQTTSACIALESEGLLQQCFGQGDLHPPA